MAGVFRVNQGSHGCTQRSKEGKEYENEGEKRIEYYPRLCVFVGIRDMFHAKKARRQRIKE
jgi:hypothetical protein